MTPNAPHRVYAIWDEETVYKFSIDGWLTVLLQKIRNFEEFKRSKFPRIPSEDKDDVEFEEHGAATVIYGTELYDRAVRHVDVGSFSEEDWQEELESFSVYFGKGRLLCPQCNISCTHYYQTNRDGTVSKWAICQHGHKWFPRKY